MPEAAERALVSVATAYRYFSTAEDLWWEASTETVMRQGVVVEADEQMQAAGDDPQLRLSALTRSIGFGMLDDQVPYRQFAKTALEMWFRQTDVRENERVPTRQGRRNEQIRKAIAPLRATLSQHDFDRVAHALGLVVGAEAMIALTDAVGLDVPAAKNTLLDAGRWLLAGALAELST